MAAAAAGLAGLAHSDFVLPLAIGLVISHIGSHVEEGSECALGAAGQSGGDQTASVDLAHVTVLRHRHANDGYEDNSCLHQQDNTTSPASLHD